MLNTIAGILSPSKSYASVVLADNPIGFWLLNETTGTTGDDLTANNNDLTFYNSPTLGVSTGLAGIPTAITFDGTNDRLQTATVSTFNIAASGNWSEEIWIKTNTAALGVPLTWRDSTGTNNGIQGIFALNNGTSGLVQYISSDSAGNSLILSAAGVYNDNAWHQLVISATSGGALKLYIDGVEKASSTTSRNTNTSNRFIIVAANDFGGANYAQFYTGTATAVSVYNTPLSAAQVLSHYNAGK
jgi:hypothetical protein